MLLLEGTRYYLVKKTSRIIDEAYYSSHILDLTQNSHNDCKKNHIALKYTTFEVCVFFFCFSIHFDNGSIPD